MDRSNDIEERIRFAQDRQHARLVENYRELKRNYDALMDAGFTRDEAFQLMIMLANQANQT